MQRLFSVASADGNVVDRMRVESLKLQSYYDVVNFLQVGCSERASEALRKKCSHPFQTAEHPSGSSFLRERADFPKAVCADHSKV